MLRHRAILAAVATAAFFAAAGSAYGAAAATSIAAAPTINFGDLETGGGASHEYFRLPAFAGDRLTMRVDRATTDGSIAPVFSLYDPSVDDYNLGNKSRLMDYDMGNSMK